MTIIGIIQARMGSTRLPGKVMRLINGKPLIGYVMERVSAAKLLDGVIVAIPKCDINSSLAAYLTARNFPWYAGAEENDVAGRFLEVLDTIECDAFVRVCADSPLIDPLVIDEIVAHFINMQANFFCNVNGLTPHGQNVEIINSEFYKSLSPKFTKEDREHAGFPYLYRMLPNYVVDTEADFQRVSRAIEQMKGDHTAYGMAECADLMRLQ